MLFTCRQVQQCPHPNRRHRCVYLCHCWRAACDGNIECIPACFKASLGGVPEQILRGRWVQILPIFICIARGGGGLMGLKIQGRSFRVVLVSFIYPRASVILAVWVNSKGKKSSCCAILCFMMGNKE